MATEQDGKIAMLRHALATLAYRGGKAVRGVSDEFGAHEGGRPAKILAHVCDLLDWTLRMSNGQCEWREVAPGTWAGDVARFHAALETLDRRLASGAPLRAEPERLFQGPIADALTHVGQLAMLRRMAGCKTTGENYFVAKVETGRVGADQAAPVREF
jgi:hypothetical protein